MDEHDLGNMISNIKEAIKAKEEVRFSNKAAKETLEYLIELQNILKERSRIKEEEK
jgi:hypothetical protein